MVTACGVWLMSGNDYSGRYFQLFGRIFYNYY